MRAPHGLSLAILAALNFAAAGCARRWPTVRPIADRGFTAGATPITTVDVLPIDVGVTASPAATTGADEAQVRLHGAALGSVLDGLTLRGYRVHAVIDVEGRYRSVRGDSAAALPREDLEETLASLSTYGEAQAHAPAGEGLLLPWLPVRLGEVTGADATLYVGGVAHVGVAPQRPSRAHTVGKVIFLTLFVAVVVAAAVVGFRSSRESKSAKAGSGAVRVVARGASRGARRRGSFLSRLGHAGLHAADAFGRAHTHLDVYVVHAPDEPPPPPAESEPSSMHLEMTLVDNRTGRALWHARQTFEASPARSGDVERAMRRMLNTLPRRELAVRGALARP